MSTVMHSFFVALSEPKPPSINHLYSTGPHGKKILSKEGQAFKSALTAAVVAECMTLSWKQAVDCVYREAATVRLTVGMHASLINRSWKPGGLTATGNLQSPHKKMDGPNYSKVIEDAIADGTGIDDSAHFDSRIIKIPSAVPMVEIFYEIVLEENPWHPSLSR